MDEQVIGFGKPDNPDKTWEREINGLNFIFRKAREKEGLFLYRCGRRIESGSSETSFYSDRDLTPDEVEQAQQFAAFITGRI